MIIERHPANRLLVVFLESAVYSLRSDRQLEGERSPRVYDTWWRDLPCGHYDVRAVLVRVEHGRQIDKHATESFRALGLTCPDELVEDLF